MKKRNALALALAAGLVLGGANTAHAEEGRRVTIEQWKAEQAEKDSNRKVTLDQWNAENEAKEKGEDIEGRVTLDQYNAEQAEKDSNRKVTLDQWNAENEAKEKGEDTEGRVTLDQYNAEQAEKEKNRRVTIDQWNAEQAEKDNEAETPEKPEEKPEEDQGPKVTIDEWLLKEAKKEAIEELKKAGITGEIFFKQINKAKTLEGVESLKNEILKANKDKYEKPGKEDGKKVVIPGYKIEDIAKASKSNEKANNDKTSTPSAKASNPNRAPKTGVAGMSAVAGLAAVSVAGIIATRKKED